MKLLHMTFAAYVIVILNTGGETMGCVSPQYITSGIVGIIQCSFQGASTVHWYKSTEENVIVTLTNSQKDGKGFKSGEFDIYQNGSLIITSVSIKHEGRYSVVTLDTPTSTPVEHIINVWVIAQTFDRVPFIDKCSNKSQICVHTWNQSGEISCMIRDARPAIPLSWMVRTIHDDRNISSRLQITNETHSYFTSVVTINNPFVYSSLLTFLVCKADDPSDLLEKNESHILLQNSDANITKVRPKHVYVERESTLHLLCTHREISYIVWQVNQSPKLGFSTLLHAVIVGEKYTHINDEDYKLLNDSSIVVDKVRVRHEGSYRCIASDGFEDDVTMYNVSVFVLPDPAYPVVEGCNHQRYCVLEVPPEGNVTCIVKRIRPLVGLGITTVSEGSSNVLQFYDSTITIKGNGDTSDVLLTSRYRFNGVAQSRLTVECKVRGTNIDELKLATKFDVLFLRELETDDLHNAKDDETNAGGVWSSQHIYWVIAVVMVVVLAFIVVCRLVIVKARRKTEHGIDQEETVPMVLQNDPSGKKDMFISQLKAKYQDLYDAIQPIPYIRDRLYCVDRVFVESGIEYLVAKDRLESEGTWDKLSSYHNILDDDRVKSTRRIIEGEPGYGKSTLTLQLCYDWCNKIQHSYLKNTELLILLRLRQLGGVPSISKAIKLFLLPKDSKLTESDVSDIVSRSSSVLVILDGYDEYPDQNSDINSDVISIIMREMFQEFEVILTTRSSFLPKKYPPLTKRLKLTGFDSNARDQYIRKVVVGDDVEAAEKIKQRLKENPILGDLCQVPLFYVMFAHMSHESKQLQKFNSVTSFFKYMISCFHSHMKNKMEDENVRKYDLFETGHKELDNLAFEGLSGKNQKLVWDKKDMCERLGQEFYDQYVRIGILVEEEVLDISDDPSSTISEHIQYKTEVRFYHKLFCEWYAAHHLSDYAAREDVTFDKQEPLENQMDHYLKYIDPFDLQYVYRFTCGLNHTAAEKIIGHLKRMEDGSKFAILCILEKSGKVEDVLKDVEYLCSRQVDIDNSNSLLLQRSTIQLLEIALSHKISISWVFLRNCYSTVNLSGGNHLQLKSNLSIPVLTTLNKLTIDEAGREITAEEFAAILQYSSKCLALKKLRFEWCLLPQSVQAESVSVLRSRNVEVLWACRHWHRLNLKSSRWERIDGIHTRRVVGVMTDADYQTVVNSRTWIRN